MKNTTRRLASAAVLAALVAPTTSFATNGYFADGYGTKNKGMVGAGVALPQDAMAAATNPAGMVFVGERMDVGASIFSPSPRSYSATADTLGITDGTVCGANCPFTFGGNATAQSIESDNDYFLIPHFAYNWMLNSDSSAGITVYGNGGMNTEYAGGQAQHNNGAGVAVTTPGTYGGGTAGVNLEQLFVAGTYARKINPTASWGVSLIGAVQRFEAKGLSMFGGYSTDSTNLSNNGTDTSTGFGFKLGVQGDVGGGVTLAASYQSKMNMSKFDKYKGLFAEQGDFDIPATWTAGLAWKLKPKQVLTFDVQQIMYSDVAAIANPISNLVGTSNSCATGTTSRCLGGSDGAGFGWKDMTVYKLGYQWESSPDWTWRVGYSHGDQPIPTSEVVFNILAPAVIEDHVSFGFTHNTSATSELNFAFTYALENSVSGANTLNPTQNVTLKMQQYEIEASYGVKF
ncbi:MAG: hypothetical protein GC149_19235 [Gammaproteobacteria bacterium]|nr:hypothetical protein [Gammaproteobacteria bacterium]